MTSQDPQTDLQSADSPAASERPNSSSPRSKRAGRSAKAMVAGALLVGGAGGAALLGPLVASAASPSATASASPSTTGADTEHPGGPGLGGHVEAVTDTSVIAKAIGITEAQLQTELNAGKTPAQVAAAHNVSAQKVIDAVTADGLSELAAEVKAGTLTQAQADARKAEVTQRATDQVNNGFRGGPH